MKQHVEKSWSEKLQKETTEKQNDRERKRKNLKIYSAGNRRLPPTTWLSVKARVSPTSG